ncbi:MAG: radical SAM protein [Theionarchaea archaeon]|nr:radical SAM protein [Theionarchaea archaeon]
MNEIDAIETLDEPSVREFRESSPYTPQERIRKKRISSILTASALNGVWKKLAGTLAGSCQTCGKPRLYSVFDAYITGTKPSCGACSLLFWTSLPLINHVFGKTQLQSESVKKLMSDPLVRKSMLNVVRGIRHFGLRMPQPTAVPVVIVWNYTNRCNLNCIHCHQDSGQPEEEELSTEQAFRIIDRISEAGVSILTFSGGEPLVRSDIFDAIERAHDAGLVCTIASNGILMTKDVVRKLKRAGITRVEIGLDGCNGETHDFLRGSSGAFEATIQGIRNCVAEGFDEICATMTLHHKNVGEIQDIVELAEQLGVSRFYLNRLIPAGRGKDIIDLDVTREEKIQALEYIYSKFVDSVSRGEGIQCYSRGMTYYGRMGYEKSGGQIFTVGEALSGYSRMWLEKFGDSISRIVQKYASGFGGCSAGITYAGLTAEGYLLPCVPAPIKLGNLLTEELEDIWVNDETLQYMRRRDELKNACGDCQYRFVCGGCRYTAFAVKGDWLEADPSCPFSGGE